MKQEIRFCKSADGTGLAFALVRRGRPARAGATLDHAPRVRRESPVWRPILEELSRRFRLVRFDQRGCGLSDASPVDVSFEAWVRDLEAVVDAAGLDRFALLGISQGAAMAVAYAGRHPERVSHLVLLGGYARGWNRRGASEVDLDRQETLAHLMEIGWGTQEATFRQVFTSAFMPGASLEQQRSFNDMMRVSTSPETAVRIFRAFGDIDVQADARRIECPGARRPRPRRLARAVRGRASPRLAHPEARASFRSRARTTSSCRTSPHGRPSSRPSTLSCRRAGARSFPQLTLREREVLDLIAQGFDNAQIAARLDLSEKTVRNHITRVFDKIEVENRSQAIVAARKAGLGINPVPS
jgi:pimeloyl-ACP methyl ester carboxylesterase